MLGKASVFMTRNQVSEYPPAFKSAGFSLNCPHAPFTPKQSIRRRKERQSNALPFRKKDFSISRLNICLFISCVILSIPWPVW